MNDTCRATCHICGKREPLDKNDELIWLCNCTYDAPHGVVDDTLKQLQEKFDIYFKDNKFNKERRQK